MTTSNFILKFGKYKGLDFTSTPKNYQKWLSQQDWFKMPTKPISNNLSSAEKSFSKAHHYAMISNFSERSIDSMFEAEQILDAAVEYDRKYYGMNAETKQAQMDWDYAETVACNSVDEYYNN
jgi:hypothetical protein